MRISRWGRAVGIALWGVPLLYLFYSLRIIFFVCARSYDELQAFYVRTWPDAFDADSFFGYCFTRRWHSWLRMHEWLPVAAILAVMGAYVFFSRRVIRFLNGFLQEVVLGFGYLAGVFRGLGAFEKRWVLGLFGAMLLYWGYIFFNSPIWLDEACSYLHFARQGFFFTIMNYPVPNNHILFNAICSWLAKLSFLSPVWVMRLPSVVASVLNYYLLFAVFKRFGDFRRAMVVVAGVAFVHMLSYYSVQGRGYQVQLFFIIVNALSGWMYFFPWPGMVRRYGYALFIVSAVLGFYINPLFVYHFFAILLVLGFRILRDRDWKKGRELAGAVSVVLGVVVVLYLPILIGSGPSAVADNKYVSAGRPLSDLASKSGILIYDLKYIFYYGYLSIVFLVAAFVLFLWLYRRRRLGGFFYDHALYYLVATVLAISMVTVYKRIYPLERSLCFWVLALNVMFVNLCYDVSFLWFRRVAMPVLVLFLIIKDVSSMRLLYLDHYSIRNSSDGQIYYEPQRVYPQLVALHPGSYQVAHSEDSYPVYLRLYLLGRGDSTPVVFSRDKAVGDVILVADSAAYRLPLQGYVRWVDKDGRSEFDLDSSFGIYVSKGLVGK